MMFARPTLPSWIATLVALSLVAVGPARAQTLPFDISDPTPRDVLIDVEAINGIAVTEGGVLDGSGAIPATLLPNPIAIFGNFGLIRGSWSVVGSTGTVAISTAEIEAFINAKFGGAFITAVPGSFSPSVITIDTVTGEASWAVEGRVTVFGSEADLGSVAQTADGPFSFTDAIFDGGPFDDVVISGTTAGIEVGPPGVPHFCTEAFHNADGADECGDLASVGVGFVPSYPYLPAFGLIRMTGPVAIDDPGIFGGFLQQDIGDHRWVETCGDGIVDALEQCDDGNNENGDCCSATCEIESDGSSCSDEDSCTVGDTCQTGACVSGPREPADCGNHRFCYKIKSSKDAAKFAPVTVTGDGLETSSYDLRKPLELCAPADKNDEGVFDTDAFALSYKLKRSSGEPKHVRITGIEVTDQFGTLSLDTIKEDRILVPAGVMLGSAATPLAAGTSDHFMCYKVKVTKGTPKFPKGLQATVDDLFEDRAYDIRKPTKLCFPVDKNGEGITNETQNLLCYLVKRAKGEPKHVQVVDQINTADQFGGLEVDSVVERELCNPVTTISVP